MLKKFWNALLGVGRVSYSATIIGGLFIVDSFKFGWDLVSSSWKKFASSLKATWAESKWRGVLYCLFGGIGEVLFAACVLVFAVSIFMWAGVIIYMVWELLGFLLIGLVFFLAIYGINFGYKWLTSKIAISGANAETVHQGEFVDAEFVEA